MQSTEFDTVISPDMEFTGTLKIRGGRSLSIHGVFRGEIESDGQITVEKSGAIYGSIATHNLQVSGLVQTDQEVQVRGVLSMLRGGQLIAKKISYAELEHETGARISGQLEPYEPLVNKEQQIEDRVVVVTPNQEQAQAILPTAVLVGSDRWSPRNAAPGSLTRAVRSFMESPSPVQSQNHETAPAPVSSVDLSFRSDVTEALAQGKEGDSTEEDQGDRSLQGLSAANG